VLDGLDVGFLELAKWVRPNHDRIANINDTGFHNGSDDGTNEGKRNLV
jgi:hypothetical protein